MTDAILPVAPIGPCCARCGRLVWRSRDERLVDSRGRTTCPAPWWGRVLVANAHTAEPVSALADLGLAATRAVILGTALYWLGELLLAIL